MACPDKCQQIASQFPWSARTELIERSRHEYFGAEQMQEATYMSWSIGLCVKKKTELSYDGNVTSHPDISDQFGYILLQYGLM